MLLPYTVRTFEDFIRVDIATGDSDPVYWAVYKSRFERGEAWATRFSVAMLAYYHMGVAFDAAKYTGMEFWQYLQDIYDSAPRGTERRHLRGNGGRQTLKSMGLWTPNPEDFFEKMPGSYEGIYISCQRNLYGFGPYFVLKLVDYKDACLGSRVSGMNYLARYLPDDPAKAAKLLRPGLSTTLAFDVICSSVAHKGILAAPAFEREIGPAEVETSLCGWKTTKFKGNWFGADIAEKRRQLYEVGTEEAKEFMSWLPPLVPKDTFELQL